MKPKHTKLTGIARSTLEPFMDNTPTKPHMFWFVVPWVVFFGVLGLWFAWGSEDDSVDARAAALDSLQSESRAWAQHESELVTSIGEAIKVIKIAESRADLTIHPDVASLRELLDKPFPTVPQALAPLSQFRDENGPSADIPQSVWDGVVDANQSRALEEIQADIDQLRSLNEEMSQRTRAIARRTVAVEKATHLSDR